MNWIDAREKAPEGKIFWVLTEGRDEQGTRDWVIRKIYNRDLIGKPE